MRARPLTPITLTAIVLTVVAVGAVTLFLFRRDEPPPVTLAQSAVATAPAPAPAAPGVTPDGQWTLTADGTSFVGYRVREELARFATPTDAVGRSTAVAGGMSIAGTVIQQAQVTADLRQLTSDAEQRDQALATTGLQTDLFPEARFALTQPIDLGALPQIGEIIETSATGDLTLHGVTRPVTLAMEARWDGDQIAVAGSAPVLLTDFGITPPVFGPVLSINDEASAEFQVTFTRG